jgi:hypothetical protein
MLLCEPGQAAGVVIFTGPIERAYQSGSAQALAGFREAYGPAPELSRETDLARLRSA